ncbi:sialidase family protein [Chitinophaga sp. MM2321]|uniref:sialidase family protein n=1 Tax=Chitinophaga sp. MM2321 TaxID=3137178 RepID=UPI0032D5AFF7
MKKHILYLLILIFCQTAISCVAQTPAKFIFRNGDDGYACYRIPALICIPNGDLLAFAEARKKECDDFGDIDLVMKRSSDKGKTWSAPVVVVDNGLLKAGNPAPVVDLLDPRFPGGRIFLLYNTATTSEADVKKGSGVREVNYITSTDNGKTWSGPVNITTSVHKPLAPASNSAYNFPEDWRTNALTPGHALQLTRGKNKGRLFVAANHTANTKSGDSHVLINKAHCFYSNDHGDTWQLGDIVHVVGGNESTAAELSDGSVLQNIRYQNKEEKYRILAFSRNGGEHWDTAYVAKQLPDPVCEGSMISLTYKKKHLLLFSNPASQTKRERMTITISADNGRSWKAAYLVDAGPAAYSDIVNIQSKEIGLVYEKGNDGGIVFISFPIKKIIKDYL